MNKIDKALEELNQMDLQEIVLIAEGAERMAQDTSASIGSGFTQVDDCIDGGFREGDFNVVAGIPGEGKTTAMRMFTLNLADQGIPSLWFSHEMTNRELWDSFQKMGADTSLISYVPMNLESDMDWMFRHIELAVEQYGIKAVFIDTIGDVSVSKDRRKDVPNYATMIEVMCKTIRDFGVKHNIMFFVAAHCTKNTRSKTNETDNSDIANSNGIPATATNIFHVWRDEENTTLIKIGKSRRDGSKKGWRIKFEFKNNKLFPLGAASEADKDILW